MIHEYIIKVDEDKKDIMGDMPLLDKPQELILCNDCMHRGNHNICPVFSPMDDFYCGHGERKEKR